jgi:hypothetical protein
MFSIVNIENWNDLKSIPEKIQKLYVFRGHSNRAWSLESSLERNTKNLSKEEYVDRYNFEYKMLREFRRFSLPYIMYPPKENDQLGWLSILQNYGAATRLLDFTKSLYIAAFFATEKIENDNAAIWAINRTEFAIRTIDKGANPNILQCAIDSVDKDDVVDTFMREKANEELNSGYNYYLKRILGDENEKDDILVLVEPWYSTNERLNIQQGVFLLSLNLEKTFEQVLLLSLDIKNIDTLQEENAHEMSITDIINLPEKDKPYIIKFILPKKVCDETVNDLSLMNITAATLFPGLDGFARSLNFHFREKMN